MFWWIRRKRFMLSIAIGLVVLAIVLYSRSTIRTIVDVDSGTGDVRRRALILDFVMEERVESTKFSRLGRRAGMQHDGDPRDWKIDTIKYARSRLHQNSRFHGVLSDLNNLATAWELCSTSQELRLRQAEEVLAM